MIDRAQLGAYIVRERAQPGRCVSHRLRRIVEPLRVGELVHMVCCRSQQGHWCKSSRQLENVHVQTKRSAMEL